MYIPQTSLPNPFGLSLSKPGRPLPTALRQAQGERVYLRLVPNQATLIPAIGSSAFDSTGERRLAERLEQKLDADYLLKGVGVQAQGRTTILKINYRNTRQILHTASLVAADLLTADDKEDGGIPLSCGHEGQAPVIIKLPTLRDEAFAIADHLVSAHKEGYAWGDMAVLCPRLENHAPVRQRFGPTQAVTPRAQKERRIPTGADAIQVMTMKVSKGLEFPVVTLPGVGHMPSAD